MRALTPELLAEATAAGAVSLDDRNGFLSLRRFAGESDPWPYLGVYAVRDLWGPVPKMRVAFTDPAALAQLRRLTNVDLQEKCLLGQNRLATEEQRLLIWGRDLAMCVYCGCATYPGKKLRADHFEPWIVSRRNTFVSNLVSSCPRCNDEKGQTDGWDYVDGLRSEHRVSTAHLEQRLRRALGRARAGSVR